MSLSDSWSGDPDELHGSEEILLNNEVFCDETFATKHEAFATGLHLGAQRPLQDERIHQAAGARGSRPSTAQIDAVLEIFATTAWGDTEGAVANIDSALGIVMVATRADFRFWEANADDAGMPDEFSVPDPASLSPEWRIALVARLLRSTAMAWGVGTDFGLKDDIGRVTMDEDAASTPLRKLLAAELLRGDS